MNTNHRAGCLTLLLFSFATGLFAQKTAVNELLTRADRQYDLYAYNLAILTYQQALGEDKSNAHALARVGDCHFQLNRPEESLEWYRKAQNTYNMESDVPLRLGKVLMQTGDYDGARDQFLLYAQIDDNTGRHFANVAEYAIKNAKKESQWLVKNEAINTSAADFSPTFYFSRVVFNSARTDIAVKGSRAEDLQGGNSNYLYVSQRNPESERLQKPTFLRSDLQNNRNEGPVSFSANGRKVAFTRNRFISGTRQIAETGMNMSIYMADVEDGTWKNIKAFPFNGSNYATGFPCLSPDGNKLIFASTQPGGFGGWDIYVSNFTASGWSEPRNLGTPLNTPGNEVTPFFDGIDLYFSSDWHNGFGGLDVFRASLGREEVTEVFHLGPGINSNRDDYGFIYNPNDNIGYLTSTRSGGRGNEDIWMVAKKLNNQDIATRSGQATTNSLSRGVDTRPAEYDTPGDVATYSTPTVTATSNSMTRLHIMVTDEREFPISGVEVNLSDCYGEKGFTGGDGKFYFDQLLRSIDCKVSLQKRGFHDMTISLVDFGRQNVKIVLANDIREDFGGYVLDASTLTPIRGALIQMQTAEVEVETSTDDAGFYSLRLEPGMTYLITYNKVGYTDAVVRTTFPYNSNNKITNVMLEKAYADTRSAAPGNNQTMPRSNPTRPAENTALSSPSNLITKVYHKETPNPIPSTQFNGYSIQLAAMPETPSDARLGSYGSLTRIANLYVKSENGINKIRLGIFPTESAANLALKEVLADKKNRGAWVLEERDADESLIIGNQSPAPVGHNAVATVTKGDNSAVRYSIQVGSFSLGKSTSISEYTKLNGLGNLYSTTENGYTKVRLGVWSNYGEAETAKKEAVRRGFPDAVIITERADNPEIRDYLLSNAPNQAVRPGAAEPPAPAPVVYSTMPSTNNPYLIRIAALSKPESFDPYPLEGLGVIEKRKALNSPGMTIILLGSYADKDTANKVAKQLLDMGYSDVYVVKDEKGKLNRQ